MTDMSRCTASGAARRSQTASLGRGAAEDVTWALHSSPFSSRFYLEILSYLRRGRSTADTNDEATAVVVVAVRCTGNYLCSAYREGNAQDQRSSSTGKKAGSTDSPATAAAVTSAASRNLYLKGCPSRDSKNGKKGSGRSSNRWQSPMPHLQIRGTIRGEKKKKKKEQLRQRCLSPPPR